MPRLLEESIDLTSLSFLIIDGDEQCNRTDDDEIDENSDPMLILMKKQEQESSL